MVGYGRVSRQVSTPVPTGHPHQQSSAAILVALASNLAPRAVALSGARQASTGRTTTSHKCPMPSNHAPLPTAHHHGRRWKPSHLTARPVRGPWPARAGLRRGTARKTLLYININKGVAVRASIGSGFTLIAQRASRPSIEGPYPGFASDLQPSMRAKKQPRQ